MNFEDLINEISEWPEWPVWVESMCGGLPDVDIDCDRCWAAHWEQGCCLVWVAIKVTFEQWSARSALLAAQQALNERAEILDRHASRHQGDG